MYIMLWLQIEYNDCGKDLNVIYTRPKMNTISVLFKVTSEKNNEMWQMKVYPAMVLGTMLEMIIQIHFHTGLLYSHDLFHML